jgi:phenylalanyl-tRNA synthetase beta chain
VKFSLSWLDDFVDVTAAGGAEGVRASLDRAGIPIESVERRDGDAILEAEITPNRPDAMAHRGLAREVAAMAGLAGRDASGRYAEPESSGESTEQVTSVVIQVPSLCRRFGARLVRGATPGRPAPEHVRSRLSRLGARSISAAVDATNYALWDTGQPLHAFDFDRLAGGVLLVRKARRGERPISSSPTPTAPFRWPGSWAGSTRPSRERRATFFSRPRGGTRPRCGARRAAWACTRTRRTVSSAGPTSRRSRPR